MSSSSAAALNGYRRLLKSASIVFKNDSYALKQAKIQLKNEFIKNKYVTSSNELKQLFRGIDEVDEMLKFNIVQGKLNEKGNYAVSLSNEHKVTVEAGQDDPHGPSIEVVDRSYIGDSSAIKVENVSNKRK